MCTRKMGANLVERSADRSKFEGDKHRVGNVRRSTGKRQRSRATGPNGRRLHRKYYSRRTGCSSDYGGVIERSRARTNNRTDGWEENGTGVRYLPRDFSKLLNIIERKNEPKPNRVEKAAGKNTDVTSTGVYLYKYRGHDDENNESPPTVRVSINCLWIT